MSQFPTNKTVPLDKDIAVKDALPYPANSLAREQLSVVLSTLNTFAQTLENEIDGERSLLRMSATGTNTQVSIASAAGTRVPDGVVLGVMNGSELCTYVGGTIDFATGTVTGGGANFTPVDFAGQASKWITYGISLLPDNTILVTPGGVFGTTAANATPPEIFKGISIGYVAIQDDGSAGVGTIEDVLEANITQLQPLDSTTIVSDDEFAVVDPNDTTNRIEFDANGASGTKTTLRSNQLLDRTIDLPDISDVLVTRTNTETLSNKIVAFSVANNAASGSNAAISLPASGILRLTNGALVSIGSVVAGASGQMALLVNATGVNVKVLNDYSGATAADRILTGNGDLNLGTNESLLIIYDATSTRWRVISASPAKILSEKQVQFSTATDSTATGNNATISAFTTGIVRLTNASLSSISGIPAGSSGQFLILENKTGNYITVNNEEATATAANRIQTGTGGSVSMPANATFLFTYDSTSSRWQLTGGSGSGSGSGTSKNYLSSVITSQSPTPNTGNGNFEIGSTTGWSLGTVGTLTSGIPTGAPTFGSGASGNLSISAVSSGQLAGNYSLSYASSAATTQGNMLASDAFYIDSEDQAKVLTWKFYYKAQSGASNANWSGTSASSFGVAVYDVTNSSWFSSTANFALTQNSGIGLATGTFQTAINTTQVRLVIYNANATAGAVTLYFDDFSVGPDTATPGIVPQAYATYIKTVADSPGTFTPSSNALCIEVEIVGGGGGGGTAAATGAGQASAGGGGGGGGYVRKLITSLASSYSFTVGSGGSPGGSGGSTTFSGGAVSLTASGGSAGAGGNATAGPAFSSGAAGGGGPASGGDVNVNGGQGGPGVVLSSGQFGQGPGGNSGMFGSAPQSIMNNGTATGTNGNLYGAGGNGGAAGASTGAQAGGSGGNGIIIIREFYRGQNIQMSSDTDTRVVAASAAGTPTGVISTTATPETVVYPGVSFDTHGAYNASTGVYTVPVTGYYSVDAFVDLQAATSITAGQLQINMSGSFHGVTAPIQAAASRMHLNTSAIISCYAGQTIQIQINNVSATGALSYLTGTGRLNIRRLSGPATIAATETVAMSATGTAPGGTFPNASFQTIDSSRATWSKAIDSHNSFNTSTGVYSVPVSGTYEVNGVYSFSASGTGIRQMRFICGSQTIDGPSIQGAAGGASSCFGTVLFKANAGDSIYIQAYQNAGGTLNMAAPIYLAVRRVGN